MTLVQQHLTVAEALAELETAEERLADTEYADLDGRVVNEARWLKTLARREQDVIDARRQYEEALRIEQEEDE